MILFLIRNQIQHLNPILNLLDCKYVIDEDWLPETVERIKPDLLVTFSDEWYEAYRCVIKARELGIPSLLLMDGILEWRHQWENPQWGSGGGVPYKQPIICDKVACLGWQSARTLEHWGNVGKCEIIGVPRFDHYITEPVIRTTSNVPKRLLVMTANTPGFTDDQRSTISKSLCDVKEFLQAQKQWEPVWRVRKGLDLELGLSDNYPEFRDLSMKEVLSQVDAVISTPSTVILEAMLTGIPTAILDYSNSPPYVQSAWMITAPQHIPATLEDLFDSPARRLLHQDEILHNCLECYSPAAPRMLNLIHAMAKIGKDSKLSGTLPELPDRIVPIENIGHALPSQQFNLSSLYPGHPIFRQTDLTGLQLQLTHANVEIAELKRQIQKSKKKGLVSSIIRKAINRDW